jgi:lysophospholipase L1-like esterase
MNGAVAGVSSAAEGQKPHRSPGDRAQAVLLNSALVFGAVLLCCIALEGTLRVVFARSLDFAMEMWKYATLLKQPVSDPQLSFVHAPNRSAFLMGVPVSISSYGHRDQEYKVEKHESVYRIVVLGDSTTFGWGAPVEQTIAKTLEAEINKQQIAGYDRVEVINAGVGNYNTVQEVTHYLTYERAFKPDLVLLQYFINDAEPVPVERSPGLLGRSYLLAFALSRFDTVMRYSGFRPNWKEYYAALYDEHLPAFRASRDALARLAAVTKEDGTALLVTILPELHQINDGYPFIEAHNKIKTACVASRIPVIDLIDGLRGHGDESTLWVTPTDAHPNGKASALVVAQILPVVLDAIRANRKSISSNTADRVSLVY